MKTLLRNLSAAWRRMQPPGIDGVRMLLLLAYRNILRQPRRSLLVATTGFVGMLGLLFTMATVNGFIASMIRTGIESGLGHVQIRPEGFAETRRSGLVMANAAAVQRKLARANLPDDWSFAPRFEREGVMRIGIHSIGVQMLGVDPRRESATSGFDAWMLEGDLFQKPTSPRDREFGVIPCVIGAVNANRLEVGPGDNVVLSITNEEGDLKSARARVAGVFQSPAEPVDRNTVLVKRADLGDLFLSRTDTKKDAPEETAGPIPRRDAFGYFVFLGPSLTAAEEIKARIRELIGDEPVDVMTYAELEPLFPQMLQISDQFSYISFFIMMIGFALILYDSVSMSVFERMREIGIVRAIGARPGFLFWTVIFESVLLALSGALLGLAVGALIIAYFQAFGLDLGAFAEGMETFGKSGSVIHPYLRVTDALEGLFLAILVSFLAGIYPARKAVKIEPVRAIYHR